MALDFNISVVAPPAPQGSAGDDVEVGATVHDLVVIGGGPAGLTAALYACRNGIKPLVFTGHMPGGQIATTERMENYPGFPDGISGPDLAQRMVEQVKRFAPTMLQEGVRGVDFSVRPFEISSPSGTFRTRSVIIATGSFPRRLGVKGESEYFGRGVSTCATCDGFFYRDRRVVVIGGGDSAIEEGLFLTKFANEVIVIHRRDELRASDILQERAFANPTMRFVWDSVVEEITGQQTVQAVRVRNVKIDEVSLIDTDGVFVYVGLVPATKVFQGQLELDDSGYVVTDRRLRASVPGVYAAGDVQSPGHRQAVIAAGSGAMAAMEVDRYLAEIGRA
jgi:thioredoxin reductase (NADPH)